MVNMLVTLDHLVNNFFKNIFTIDLISVDVIGVSVKYILFCFLLMKIPFTEIMKLLLHYDSIMVLPLTPERLPKVSILFLDFSYNKLTVIKLLQSLTSFRV